MANKRIHALTNTATAFQAGDYIALDNSAYTEAKRLEASVLQTAIDLDGLTPTDGNFIVGDGSTWVAESGATVRASMGLGTMATEAATSYLAATGATTGATSSAQDFTNGITVAGGSNGISAAGVVTGTKAVIAAAGVTDVMQIGANAAPNITTASYGMAIGASSAREVTNSSGFVAVGSNSGRYAVGSYWIAIGAFAGFNLTSGNYWTAIGNETAIYTNAGANATTNTNFIAIGHDARFSADGTSNEVVIGYQGRGNGSNTTTIGNSSTTHFYGLGIHVLPSGGAPASAAATGTAGSITWDSSYIYICTATDTWARVAIATW